ncbi:hypothetical protein NDU88_001448 [Pleurodeles waltl]|uniref:Uncharacterized protein n=1 Tax=Pleurodeles waltl TaxID=8319 RepID=A0AAV7UU27_PLEWA|nr:hypothetical protein NDU88_001448 [Pleurodeles waltl]
MLITDLPGPQEEHGEERQLSRKDKDGGIRPSSTAEAKEQADPGQKVVYSPSTTIVKSTDNIRDSCTTGDRLRDGKFVGLPSANSWPGMVHKAEIEGVDLENPAITDSSITQEILVLNEGDISMIHDKTCTALARGPEAEVLEHFFLLSDRSEGSEDGLESDLELGLKDPGEGNDSKTSNISELSDLPSLRKGQPVSRST